MKGAILRELTVMLRDLCALPIELWQGMGLGRLFRLLLLLSGPVALVVACIGSWLWGARLALDWHDALTIPTMLLAVIYVFLSLLLLIANFVDARTRRATLHQSFFGSAFIVIVLASGFPGMLENSARADLEQQIGLANLTQECLHLYEASLRRPHGQRTFTGKSVDLYPALRRLQPREVQVFDDAVRVRLGSQMEHMGYHLRLNLEARTLRLERFKGTKTTILLEADVTGS